MPARSYPLPPDLHPAAAAVPVIVLGDFGRDAGIRFCSEMARRERRRVRELLPAGAPFFDEYRRIALTLVGDLPFVKERVLEPFRRSERTLDDRVLVGFDGGPAPRVVAARLGILVLEALAGPVARGAEQAVIALPCNTLAPVSWALDCHFTDRGGVAALLDEVGGDARPRLERDAMAVADLLLEFPTVPTAALAAAGARGADVVLPLGTPGIAETYRRARRRMRGAPEVVDADDLTRGVVADAIHAAIGGDAAAIEAQRVALLKIVERARDRSTSTLEAIEACTDLDYGVGLDSTSAYAESIVDTVYGPRGG